MKSTTDASHVSCGNIPKISQIPKKKFKFDHQDVQPSRVQESRTQRRRRGELIRLESRSCQQNHRKKQAEAPLPYSITFWSHGSHPRRISIVSESFRAFPILTSPFQNHNFFQKVFWKSYFYHFGPIWQAIKNLGNDQGFEDITGVVT